MSAGSPAIAEALPGTAEPMEASKLKERSKSIEAANWPASGKVWP